MLALGCSANPGGGDGNGDLFAAELVGDGGDDDDDAEDEFEVELLDEFDDDDASVLDELDDDAAELDDEFSSELDDFLLWRFLSSSGSLVGESCSVISGVLLSASDMNILKLAKFGVGGELIDLLGEGENDDVAMVAVSVPQENLGALVKKLVRV